MPSNTTRRRRARAIFRRSRRAPRVLARDQRLRQALARLPAQQLLDMAREERPAHGDRERILASVLAALRQLTRGAA